MIKLAPYLLLASLVLTACNSNKNNTESAPTNSPAMKVDAKTPVSVNKETTSVPKIPEIISNLNVEELKQGPHNHWFTPRYERAVMDEDRVAHLATLLEDVEILGFVGTWCGDTKRDLPNLFKILDEIEYDDSKIDLVAVDRSYKDPSGNNTEWNVKRVPTFIFLKDNKEVGRYVERPRVSLIEDIIKILEENK